MSDAYSLDAIKDSIYIVRDEDGEEVCEAYSYSEACYLASYYRGDFYSYN